MKPLLYKVNTNFFENFLNIEFRISHMQMIWLKKNGEIQ